MDRPGNMEGAQSSFGKKDGQETKRTAVAPRNKGFVVLQNVSVKQRECMLPD
ncbi:hypothetical protein Q7C36_003410 [Tachysurus vachellii]|uniref:Uncharacterized protein n=1 Tax=Tachysurus vachellii TaxID=175792 RepID=A0AA88TF27_TACVA|nr:hypothetical protein Q7C36_003410 [Tachysurus vachellii]